VPGDLPSHWQDVQVCEASAWEDVAPLTSSPAEGRRFRLGRREQLAPPKQWVPRVALWQHNQVWTSTSAKMVRLVVVPQFRAPQFVPRWTVS